MREGRGAWRQGACGAVPRGTPVGPQLGPLDRRLRGVRQFRELEYSPSGGGGQLRSLHSDPCRRPFSDERSRTAPTWVTQEPSFWAGVGIFAKKKLSDKLSAVCGGKKELPRTQVTKLLWVYIKKNKLSKGRTELGIFRPGGASRNPQLECFETFPREVQLPVIPEEFPPTTRIFG